MYGDKESNYRYFYLFFPISASITLKGCGPLDRNVHLLMYIVDPICFPFILFFLYFSSPQGEGNSLRNMGN